MSSSASNLCHRFLIFVILIAATFSLTPALLAQTPPPDRLPLPTNPASGFNSRITPPLITRR